jgi:ATP-dependent exoDNAse (exonuclease V) beta subunit
MGGSTYAKKFEKEFDRERIARAYAKKNELDVNSVLEYWDNLGKVSMDYGTSIHTALEHYSKSAKVFGHEGAMPRQKHLKQAVEAFLRVSDFDRCIAEPLITDVEKGMSGWIDNLRFLDDKRVVVEDYKTNTFNSEEDYQKKWPVKLRAYQHQFNYYGTILDNHGYVVTGTVAWHWHEGKWNKHANPFTPVKEYLRENHDS